MAHFYGTMRGNRGEMARSGSAQSGLEAQAASWAGSVKVELYVRDGIDCARVALAPWRGAGVSHELYDGPVAEYRPHASTLDLAA